MNYTSIKQLLPKKKKFIFFFCVYLAYQVLIYEEKTESSG